MDFQFFILLSNFVLQLPFSFIDFLMLAVTWNLKVNKSGVWQDIHNLKKPS